MEHGPFWFMDASKFKNQSIFNSCLDNIAAEVNRSREDFISEYYNNYTAPSFPPAWKTLEVFSKRLLKLIDKSENINTRSMGFPQEWKNEPLWIIKA